MRRSKHNPRNVPRYHPGRQVIIRAKLPGPITPLLFPQDQTPENTRPAPSQLIALWPAAPGDCDGLTCLSLGRESGKAVYSRILRKTRPATAVEAARVASRLTRLGFTIFPIDKAPAYLFERRALQAKAWRENALICERCGKPATQDRDKENLCEKHAKEYDKFNGSENVQT